MKRKGKIWLFVVVIAIVALAVTTITGVSTQYGDRTTEYVKSVSEIRFGIDISGGVEVTFSPVIPAEENGEAGEDGEEAPAPAGAEAVTRVTAEQLNSAQAVMEQRLANLGITDYELFQDGGNGRLILRFPWKENESTYDPEAAIQELAATALLTFREGMEYDSTTGLPTGVTEENIILQGDDVASATAAYDSQDGSYFVALSLSDAGAVKFSEATTRLAEENGTISIWLDNTIISAPTVQQAITGNEASITGSFTAEEVTQLANTINAGSLPFAMQAESYSTISSALGGSALRAMVIAGIVAMLLVVIFMIVSFKLPGVIASISLIGQTAGTLAFISGYFAGVFNGFTLTLPGIAGIILAVGMGVDANIIMAERIKEELRGGKKLDAAIRNAFKRGLAPVIDGNITVLIVSVILIGAFGPTDTIFAKLLYPFFFAFGASTTGTIYSFGYTLLVGVLLNFVFGILATRAMIFSASKFQKLRNPALYGGLKPGQEPKEEKDINFLGNRKKYFVVSGALLAIIVVASFVFTPALDIEFKGGAIVSYTHTGVVDTAAVQETITETLGKQVTLQEGTNSATGGSMLTVSVAGGNTLTLDELEGLATALEEAYPDSNFAQAEVSNVSATMGREFLLKCLVAVLLAAVLILLYIAYRFRKIGGWLGGLTAIVALLHDLVIVYGVFVLCGFTISGNFIAALLVILGYSINDTVVIYDRVRENRALYGKRMPFNALVNQSINQSLNRSMKTTFTTVMALLCVCVFALVYGLGSIFSFAFPIMIGLISGTYSSLCIAGPLWVTILGREGGKKQAAKKA